MYLLATPNVWCIKNQTKLYTVIGLILNASDVHKFFQGFCATFRINCCECSYKFTTIDLTPVPGLELNKTRLKELLVLWAKIVSSPWKRVELRLFQKIV